MNDEPSATYPLLLKSVVNKKERGDVLVGVEVTTVEVPLIVAVHVTCAKLEGRVTVEGNTKDNALNYGIVVYGVIVNVYVTPDLLDT